MSDAQQRIAELAAGLASRMPSQTLELVAETVEASDSPDSARNRVAQHIVHTYYRKRAIELIEAWKSIGPELSVESVALAVRTASAAHQAHRTRQTVELVWTGPDSDAVPFRRTEQAVLQVLDSAQERITLVSYAVYRIPNVCDALVRAARRGAKIDVIVETPERTESEDEYSTLRALGREVAACASVYYWPIDQRAQADTGKRGILHVKCAVADRRCLFLSSANLTKYAFTVNMELGMLVTGGSLPKQIEQHFDRLIAKNVLAKLRRP